jgi:hypothetical protein
MSLLTDCLTAGGTLIVACGSGLQAYGEFIHYGEISRKLGLTEAAEAVAELANSLFWILAPLGEPKIAAGNYEDWSEGVRAFIPALRRNWRARKSIGTAKLTDSEKSEARSLIQKIIYWTLIMFGSLLVFVAIVIAIIQDIS